MKYFLVIILFAACTHKSEMKFEEGKVIEKQYFPDTQQTVTGTGFTSNGKLVFTQHQIGEHEKYMVIFKCAHGVVFAINRSDLYGKLSKDDKVKIKYYEILDNKSNEVEDLEFYDASTIK